MGAPPQCIHDDANDAPLDACSNEDGTAGVPMDMPARQSLPSNLALHPVPGKRLGVRTICQRVLGGEVVDEDVKDRWYLPPMAGRRTNEDWCWAKF